MAGDHAMIMEMTAMMKRVISCCLFVFCLGVFKPVYGRELSRYDETVVLHSDGSAAIRLSLAFADQTEPGVLIPVRHAPLLNLQAHGMAPAAIRQVENKGTYFVALDFAGSGISPAAIEITFQVKNYFESAGPSAPFGNKDLGYRFVNVTFARIEKFSAELILPGGFVFNAISNFSPKPKKSGMAFPYTISRKDGKNVASIAADDVQLGDEVTLNCTFKSTKKSKLLLLALIALAVAYLVLFRGMLKNGKNAAGAEP
jgi:hypothetical protein